ncbi:MAG: ABC transporter family substrate-binding protein [Mycobacterium sp.]|nr:ABC transporter family substrate-binding protein [Mycobacterium sp.]
MNRHRSRSLLAAAAVVAVAVAGCSDSGHQDRQRTSAGTQGTGAFADCGTHPDTCDSGQAKQGGTIRYTIEKTIPGWNPDFADSNLFEVGEVMDGVMPAVFGTSPDLKPFLNTDLMQSATQTNSNPQTLVYKVKKDAMWSDGQPIGFDDFQYLKDVSDGITCPACGPASTAGYKQIASMSASDHGKTVTMVMRTPFADWQSLFSLLLPAHIAAQHGDLSTARGLNASFRWFNDNVPTWSGGPFLISSYSKDQAITETPNPKWYGASKSTLDELVFRIITNQAQEAPALQNHDVDVIYPEPSPDLLAQVKQIPGVQSYLGKGLIWDHFDLNENNQFLKDRVLRTAIFTAINRKDLIARTIGPLGITPAPLGNHMYVPGQPGYQDNVTNTGQGSGNLAKAKRMLAGAGYTGVGSKLTTAADQPVAIRCLYSVGNKARQSACLIAQNTLKQLGINVTLRASIDLHEIGTGDFDMVIFGWVGTPFAAAGAQQVYELKGGADYAHNNDPAAEKLINQAAASTNPSTVRSLLNQADKLITADAFELPLYQKPTFLAARTNIVNIRDDASSVGPPYNDQQWGIRAK